MKFRNPGLFLNVLLFSLLIGSAGLNLLLYQQAKKYYLELNQTRLNPLGLDDYPVDLAVKPTEHLRVVFFGDSRAADWSSPQMNGVEFINRGIGSQTSVQAMQRFSAHVNSLKPDVVVIQLGINDLKTVALFPDRRDAIVAACKANLRRIVEAARKQGAFVVVTTLFPVGDVPLARRPFWSDDIEQAVKEVNADILTLTDAQTVVLDSFSLLADRHGRVLQKYQTDELHINVDGYNLLNRELTRVIDQKK